MRRDELGQRDLWPCARAGDRPPAVRVRSQLRNCDQDRRQFSACCPRITHRHMLSSLRAWLMVPRLLRGTRHGTSPHVSKGHDAPHRDLRSRTPSYRTEHLLATAPNHQPCPTLTSRSSGTPQRDWNEKRVSDGTDRL